MTKNKSNKDSARTIRRRAEERLKKKKAESPRPAKKDVGKLVHELEVHQIELEMQNEELQRARQEIEASRNRYADLYDFAPIGYFTIDRTGKIREVNLTGAGLLGVGRSFLIGKPFSLWVMPGSQDEYHLCMKKMLNSGERETCELQLQRKDGTSFYALLESSTFHAEDKIPQFRTAVIDITSGRQRDAALKRSELLYRLLYERNPAGIFRAVFDSETLKGRRIECNDAYARILGYGSREEIGGEAAEIIFPPRKDWKKYAQRLFRDGSLANIAVRLRRRTGKSAWVLASYFLTEERVDDLPIIEATVVDITDRKAAERRLQASYEKLRSLSSELVMAEAKERQTLATTLHDTVAQTLAAAKMNLENLQGYVPSEGSKSLNQARDFLTQAITQTRSIMADLSPPVLYEIGFIPALEWLTEQVANRHGIPVKLDNKDGVQRLPRDVQVLLFHSVRELLMNVVQHAKAKKAKVIVSESNGHVRIEVIDDGIGFDKVKTGYRGDLSGGFGLFSIRERLKYFGGQFNIKSKQDAGTRIVMIVPQTGGKASQREK